MKVSEDKSFLPNQSYILTLRTANVNLVSLQRFFFFSSSYISGLNDKITHFQPIKKKQRDFLNSIINFNKSLQVTHVEGTTDPQLSHDTSNQSHKTFPEIPSPPTSHAGGSVDIDIHKLEVLRAASAVQKASATVPDQEHPEKYMNLDSATLEEIVNNNLWYEDTQVLRLKSILNRRKVKKDLTQKS